MELQQVRASIIIIVIKSVKVDLFLQNNFNCSLFSHFAEEASIIWYLISLIVHLPLDIKIHLLAIQNGGMSSD